MAPPGHYRFSPFRWVAWQVGRLVVAFFRGLRDTATWFVGSAKDECFSRKPGPVLTLVLISLPVAALGSDWPS